MPDSSLRSPMILLFRVVYTRVSTLADVLYLLRESLSLSLHQFIFFPILLVPRVEREMGQLSLAYVFFVSFLLLANPNARTADGATFTLLNKCSFTIWPGILSSAGSPPLGTTGFELPAGMELSIQAPAGWSGRFWGRTGCAADAAGRVVCATGDCGSGFLQCNGAGAAPPATLAEFTLDGASGQDFYDVSLVDGFNLPLIVEAKGGSGGCMSTGCGVDLNLRCPAELRADSGEACRSACEAFGKPEFCCSGEFASPNSCQPSAYSQVFKSACPRAYSYAYDDATSTFTCSGGDYSLTFCPSGTPLGSLKSSQDATTATVTAEPDATATEGTIQREPWLASLATGGATKPSTGPTLLVLAALLSAISLLQI